MTRLDRALFALLIVATVAAVELQRCEGPAEPWLRRSATTRGAE